MKLPAQYKKVYLNFQREDPSWLLLGTTPFILDTESYTEASKSYLLPVDDSHDALSYRCNNDWCASLRKVIEHLSIPSAYV